MSKISDQRRADILYSALEEFGLRGVDGASMSEIAARAGIGKSTIYEYFPSKAELFHATCNMKIRQIKDEIAAIFAQDIPFSTQLELYFKMMLEMVELVDLNELARIFARDSVGEMQSAIQKLANDVADMMGRAIRRAQAAGELTEDLDVIITAEYLLGLPNPHLIARLRRLGREEPIKALVDLALRGIRTADTQKDS